MALAIGVRGEGWRRWLPGSLFGRLMLVLGLGLMLAQLLSAAINMAERDQLLNRGYGLPAAQRIADVVALLDSLPEAERVRVVAVFRTPPLVLSLHDAPVVPAAPLAIGQGALFAARLRAALGDERALRVAPRPPPPPGDPADEAERLHRERRAEMWQRRGLDAPVPGSAGFDMGRHGMGPRAGAPVWRTEVQLRDGRWARFDAVLPAHSERLPSRLVATLAVLLLSMLALAWVAVRWVVQPLRVLADAAQALGEDIDRPPLVEAGPREVRQAAQAFNTMQQRLAQFIHERTRMLAALSHDLKTPLTRMRLRAELLDDDEARRRFESDLHEMETMVVQTLDFLRGLGGNEPRAPVDIDALLAALQADQQAMGRTVLLEGTARAPFVGVPSLLRRALGNLVDNAVLYGERATVRVVDGRVGSAAGACVADGGQLEIQVLDDGPGIPEAELERVFQPYHRLEASRSRATGGTGLGLGIARNIAQLHGGTLTLHNRPEGGLLARLRLPRRPL